MMMSLIRLIGGDGDDYDLLVMKLMMTICDA